MLLQLGLFLIALFIFVILLSIIAFLYDRIAKLIAKKPVKPALKPHLRHPGNPVIRLTRTNHLEVLKQTFTVEQKSSKEVNVLTKENFKELLSPYFIAVDYLLELWIQNKFNLIITDDLNKYYGKDKMLEGLIRNKAIPDIYIKLKTSQNHRCGILLHELSHNLANKEAKQKNVKIQSHGKEFKRHLKLLFAPLLVDKTYYNKHHELSYHLTYETRKYSPAKDLCV
jgi:hypothetical protein